MSDDPPQPAGRIRQWLHHGVEQPLEELAGGPARLKVVVVLACVLALDAADKATVGAVAAQLKQALDIDNVQIGWLVTASTGVSAVVTLPFGMLVDRFRRTRVLIGAVTLWALAMGVSAASVSYLMLLLSRLLLGTVVAAAAPAVTSLTGDYFHPGERGRVFGYILAGELVGVAFGFLISGNLAAWLSWRASFWVLAGLSLVLVWVIWRHLPEPRRGGQSRIPLGSDRVPQPADRPAHGNGDPMPAPPRAPDTAERTTGQDAGLDRKVRKAGIKPPPARVLDRPSGTLSVWQAIRYILGMRTYRWLIVASSLGYFYFTGLRTFAIVYMRDAFDLGQAIASTLSVVIGLGAIAGVLLAGRGGDAWIRHGRLQGRVLAGGIAYLVATAAFVPGFAVTSLYVAAPFLFIAAAGIGGANPAVNAAELDVVPSGLWGRAEGVRAAFRFTLEAIAPPLFGYLAALFSGSGRGFAGATDMGDSSTAGLRWTFLSMLVTLAAAGAALLWRARTTYPADVAAAAASERAGDRK